jgi:hypothetical protein
MIAMVFWGGVGVRAQCTQGAEPAMGSGARSTEGSRRELDGLHACDAMRGYVA